MESVIDTKIIQAEKEHFSTIVFLHGLLNQNQHWQQWKDIFDSFIKNCFPHTNFVLPLTSSKSIEVEGLELKEITFPANAWYSMWGDLNKIKEEIPLEEVEKWVRVDKEGLLKSRIEINKLIQQEINFGIPPQKIIVAGFSQGGSIALEVGLNSRHSLGGVICMGGFLLFNQEELSKLKQSKNIDLYLPW